MALLKKDEQKKTAKKPQGDTSHVSNESASALHAVLKHPRVTEKAAILSGNNIYTFEIDPKATKIDVLRAVKNVYKVDPVKVTISTLPAKRKFVRGRRGTTSAVKKAMVYLKKGDSIEFV